MLVFVAAGFVATQVWPVARPAVGSPSRAFGPRATMGLKSMGFCKDFLEGRLGNASPYFSTGPRFALFSFEKHDFSFENGNPVRPRRKVWSARIPSAIRLYFSRSVLCKPVVVLVNFL